MSTKRGKQCPVFIQEDDRRSSSGGSFPRDDLEKIKAFRAVHAHFSDVRQARVTADYRGYSSTPTLEIRLAMQQAKTAYDSMLDIQERLNQAYYEIMKDPS